MLVTTHKQLGDALGIPRQRISSYLPRDWWTWGNGPWDEAAVEEIKATLSGRVKISAPADDKADKVKSEHAEERAARMAAAAEERRIDTEIKLEALAAARLKNEMAMGGFLKRADVEAQAVARILSVRAKLQEIPLRAHLLAHKSEAEIEAVLASWMKEACDHYAHGGN